MVPAKRKGCTQLPLQLWQGKPCGSPQMPARMRKAGIGIPPPPGTNPTIHKPSQPGLAVLLGRDPAPPSDPLLMTQEKNPEDPGQGKDTDLNPC